MLFSNFIYMSTFTCNIEIAYAFIYVDQYVDLLTSRSQYVDWVDRSTGMQFYITQHYKECQMIKVQESVACPQNFIILLEGHKNDLYKSFKESFKAFLAYHNIDELLTLYQKKLKILGNLHVVTNIIIECRL